MAIQFVGGAVKGRLGGTGTDTIPLNSGLTGGIASAVAAGDFVVAAYEVAGISDLTLAITDGTNPYTLIGSELNSPDTFDANLRVAYKIMGGTPDTDATFGSTSHANNGGAMAVYVFRGVDTTTPLDGVAPTTATGIDSVLANPPAITPSSAGAYICVVGGGAHNDGNRTYSSSDLTDFMSVGIVDTNSPTIGIGHKPDWASGSFDPAAFTFSGADGTSFSWAALSFVLRPAATSVKLKAMHHYRLMAGA